MRTLLFFVCNRPGFNGNTAAKDSEKARERKPERTREGEKRERETVNERERGRERKRERERECVYYDLAHSSNRERENE